MKRGLLGLLMLVAAGAAGWTGCVRSDRPTGPERIAAKRVVWKGSGKKVVGYFTNWAQYRAKCKFTPQHIDPSLFTHINYSFAKVVAKKGADPMTFKLAPFEHNDLGSGGQYAQVNSLKRRFPHLKTLIAVGGWGHNDEPTAWIFTTLVSKKEYRTQFIRDTIGFIRDNGFDGLDLDWEFPADPDRGGHAEDTKNYTAWVKELRAAFREEAKATNQPELLLTMASSAGGSQFPRIEFAELKDDFDWINIMTYDFYGAWSKTTGANSPLSGDSTPGGDSFVKSTVARFIEAGIPPEKLVLGLPTYGRHWAGVGKHEPNSAAAGPGPKGRCTGAEGFLSFYEIQELIETGGYKSYWDDRSGTPYAYSTNQKVWISYDDVRSIRMKVDYIEKTGLGGAMFWAIDLDDFQNGYPLIKTVSKRLRRD